MTAPAGRKPLFVDDDEAALLTDLYELTMAHAYHAEGMRERAVFSLYFRRLPPRRNFALACGLDDALAVLERFRFSRAALDFLATKGFPDRFLRFLEELRFTGDVFAMPEGTPVFPDEPLLEVEAPIVEAQLVETIVINQMHLETVLASKAARVVLAAGGRRVVDFGLRRMHGADAGLKSARAFAVAGVDATSNVLAGMRYGIPIAGTMAHSYVEAHASEREAFTRFAEVFPEATLLVDTYDTAAGVAQVAELAKSGAAARVTAVRLDSGDLLALSLEARRILDAAGLAHVQIFASGGLDEEKVAALVDAGAPIDGFGVGTSMGVSDDAPTLDMAYKLVEYAGLGRLKTSTGKQTLPGRKQVFRREAGGVARGDVIGRAGESLAGRPLLERVMNGGARTSEGTRSLDDARERARRELSRLRPELLRLESAPAYPVAVSDALLAARDEVLRRLAAAS